MDVARIDRWADARGHLDNLRATIGADIRPLLNTPHSAPFAVCREVFSYVDYVGALYAGEMRVGSRFKSAVRELVSVSDSNYRTRADELYEMYRCGTVHQFKPKTLINPARQMLSWFSYRGPRAECVTAVDGVMRVVTHLVPLRHLSTSHWWLPVSLDCLVDDLEQAIEAFANHADEPKRVAAWNSVAGIFSGAQEAEFVL